MFEKLGAGTTRNVYSFGDRRVIKIPKGIDGIKANRREYSNSKEGLKFLGATISILGILNFQEKVEPDLSKINIDYINNIVEKFDEVLPPVQLTLKGENEQLSKEDDFASFQFHHIFDNLQNFGVNSDKKVILVDGDLPKRAIEILLKINK